MKKIICILLLLLLGCHSPKVEDHSEEYRNYYHDLDRNTTFQSDSQFYDFHVEVTKVNSSYRYYVFIDEPKSALFNCVVLVREDEKTYEEQDKMMPSSGIFDHKYSLIPNQVNKDKGYMKGIMLSGESDHEDIVLDILVEWMDKNNRIATREYLHYENN